jgi:HAD superfamily hydrolase (TIGR01509 family)
MPQKAGTMGREKALLLDCDGVMFDSVEANRAYYSSILRHLGKPGMTDAQFVFGHMQTADETLRFLFPDPEEHRRALEYRRRITYLPYIAQMRMEPGLTAMLTALKPRYATGVCTNRTDTMARVIEDHGLLGYFDVVVTARDVARPKPDPEMLKKAAASLGVEVRNAVYVGDSAVDAEAARAAGMPFAAYKAPNLAADRHIVSHAEIPGLLETWL